MHTEERPRIVVVFPRQINMLYIHMHNKLDMELTAEGEGVGLCSKHMKLAECFTLSGQH